MTDQENLFKRICKRFKKRSVKWCSGYLHGILNEGKHKKPDPVYLGITRTLTDVGQRDYNNGYLWGFLDARGEDAFEWEWARKLALSGKVRDFVWWLR